MRATSNDQSQPERHAACSMDSANRCFSYVHILASGPALGLAWLVLSLLFVESFSERGRGKERDFIGQRSSAKPTLIVLLKIIFLFWVIMFGHCTRARKSANHRQACATAADTDGVPSDERG